MAANGGVAVGEDSMGRVSLLQYHTLLDLYGSSKEVKAVLLKHGLMDGDIEAAGTASGVEERGGVADGDSDEKGWYSSPIARLQSGVIPRACWSTGLGEVSTVISPTSSTSPLLSHCTTTNNNK